MTQYDESTPLWALGRGAGALMIDGRKVRAGGRVECSARWDHFPIEPAEMDEFARQWLAFRARYRPAPPAATGDDQIICTD